MLAKVAIAEMEIIKILNGLNNWTFLRFVSHPFRGSYSLIDSIPRDYLFPICVYLLLFWLDPERKFPLIKSDFFQRIAVKRAHILSWAWTRNLYIINWASWTLSLRLNCNRKSPTGDKWRVLKIFFLKGILPFPAFPLLLHLNSSQIKPAYFFHSSHRD